MADDDVVTIVLKRKLAEELVHAYLIALGGTSYKKGQVKKKKGGGKKYSPPPKKYKSAPKSGGSSKKSAY